jgi:hypothetical protein
MKSIVGKGALVLLLPLFIFSLTRYKLITEPDEEILRLTAQAVKNKHSINKYNSIDLYILEKLEPDTLIPDASGRTALEYAIYSYDLALVKSVADMIRNFESDKCLDVFIKLKKHKEYFSEDYLIKVERVLAQYCQLY